MSVNLIVHDFLLHHVEGRETIPVEGRNVGECLAYLVKMYPSIKNELFDRRGKLRGYIEVYLNDKTTFPQELQHPVQDNDELRLLMVAMGGG